jgi:membrane protein YdbS with pleckstrin-like domain
MTLLEAATMTDQTAMCANCDRRIGRLEKSFQWEGRPVCQECYERLSRAAAGAPPQATAPGPSSAAETPPEEAAPSEAVEWVGCPAVIRLAPLYGLIGLLCVGGLVLAYYTTWWVAVSIPLLLAIVLGEEVQRRSIRYTITTKRVIAERGILSKDRHEVRISDIREINLDQTFAGRIFRFGSVGIDTAAEVGGEIDMVNIPAPRRVLELLHSLRG